MLVQVLLLSCGLGLSAGVDYEFNDDDDYVHTPRYSDLHPLYQRQLQRQSAQPVLIDPSYFQRQPPVHSHQPPVHSHQPPVHSHQPPLYQNFYQQAEELKEPSFASEKAEAEPVTRFPYLPSLNDPSIDPLDAEFSGLWYPAEDKLIRPSETAESGYIPQDVLKFREKFHELRNLYKDFPLLDEGELVSGLGYSDSYMENNRKGRLFGFNPFGNLFGNPFNQGGQFGNGLLNIFFPGLKTNNMDEDDMDEDDPSLMTNVIAQHPIAKHPVVAAATDAIHRNPVVAAATEAINRSPGVSSANKLVKTPKPVAKYCFAGVETCSNHDGVCEQAEVCHMKGGKTIGTCYDCPNASSCCKYVYEDQSNTDRAIVFFQSPGFPTNSRRSSSSSLTLEVRPDVDHILVEFTTFTLPISRHGCMDDDYFEIISPVHPHGVIGPNNPKFCGRNDGQHIYLDARPGDLFIFKVVTSGVGFYDEPIIDDHSRNGYQRMAYSKHNGEYRFQLKIIQILSKKHFKDHSVETNRGEGYNEGYTNMYGEEYNTHTEEYEEYWRRENNGQESTRRRDDSEVGRDTPREYIDELKTRHTEEKRLFVPKFYDTIRAPKGCRQYFFDERGTVENYNYDGRSSFPRNLDYSVCFRVPHKSCGLTLSAIKFDVPAWDPNCMNGTIAASHGYPCCTGGLQTDNERGKYASFKESRMEKYIGVDATSDGEAKYNNPRFFFCGTNFGKTNFVISERKGPLRLEVFSDGNGMDHSPVGFYQGEGYGFRLKYEIDTGTC